MVGNNNRLQDILDYRNLANTDPMKLMQLRNEAEMPMVNRAIGSQVGDGDQPQDTVPTFNEALKDAGMLGLSVLVDASIKNTETERTVKEQEQKVKEEEEQVASLQDVTTGLNMMAAPALAYARDNPEKAMQSGGLIGMAAGGKFEGKVPGQGHGMEDNVYMPIKEGSQQVATLAVSPDEYVVDAHTMSALGNGNADEGAKYMDSMVKNIRQKAFGTDKQPNEINGLAALRPMMERV